MIGTGSTALAFALLLRHLSVVDFGRFSTVIALVTVAAGLAKAGLTVVGQRLYATADAAGRRRLIRNLVGIRLLLTPVAVVGCALFAVVAGYGTPSSSGRSSRARAPCWRRPPERRDPLAIELRSAP